MASPPNSQIQYDSNSDAMFMDLLTRDERESLLDKKMQEIRRENERRQKRYEEIEADRKAAEEAGRAVSLKTAAVEYNIPEMKGVQAEKTEEENSNKYASTGRGKRLANMSKEKLKAHEYEKTKEILKSPPADQPLQERQKMNAKKPQMAYRVKPKSNSRRQKADQDRSRRSPRSPSTDEQDNSKQNPRSPQQDNKERGKWVGKRQSNNNEKFKDPRSPQMENVEPSGRNPRSPPPVDGPPPDPSFNFLADRSRQGPLTNGNREPRHPRNFGGTRFENVQTQIKATRGRGPPGPPRTKRDMEICMTGKERREYIDWKTERDKIDKDRIKRQKKREGEWKREWDQDKADFRVEDCPQPPVSRRMEPAKRPAGRIGSGRFVSGEQEGLAGASQPAHQPAPPKGRGGRGQRGGSRGSGRLENLPPRLQRVRQSSQGSDEGRHVEEQNDSLVVKIDNEFASSPKRGAKSMSPGRGGVASRGGRGGSTPGRRGGFKADGVKKHRSGPSGRIPVDISTSEIVNYESEPYQWGPASIPQPGQMWQIDTTAEPNLNEPQFVDSWGDVHAGQVWQIETNPMLQPVPAEPCFDMQGNGYEYYPEGEGQYNEPGGEDQYKDYPDDQGQFNEGQGQFKDFEVHLQETRHGWQRAVDDSEKEPGYQLNYDEDVHNSSAESLERFIQENTLRLDVETAKLAGMQPTESSESTSQASSQDSLLRTPQGMPKIGDWGAYMDANSPTNADGSRNLDISNSSSEPFNSPQNKADQRTPDKQKSSVPSEVNVQDDRAVPDVNDEKKERDEASESEPIVQESNAFIDLGPEDSGENAVKAEIASDADNIDVEEDDSKCDSETYYDVEDDLPCDEEEIGITETEAPEKQPHEENGMPTEKANCDDLDNMVEESGECSEYDSRDIKNASESDAGPINDDSICQQGVDIKHMNEVVQNGVEAEDSLQKELSQVQSEDTSEIEESDGQLQAEEEVSEEAATIPKSVNDTGEEITQAEDATLQDGDISKSETLPSLDTKITNSDEKPPLECQESEEHQQSQLEKAKPNVDLSTESTTESVLQENEQESVETASEITEPEPENKMPDIQNLEIQKDQPDSPRTSLDDVEVNEKSLSPVDDLDTNVNVSPIVDVDTKEINESIPEETITAKDSSQKCTDNDTPTETDLNMEQASLSRIVEDLNKPTSESSVEISNPIASKDTENSESVSELINTCTENKVIDSNDVLGTDTEEKTVVKSQESDLGSELQKDQETSSVEEKLDVSEDAEVEINSDTMENESIKAQESPDTMEKESIKAQESPVAEAETDNNQTADVTDVHESTETQQSPVTDSTEIQVETSS